MAEFDFPFGFRPPEDRAAMRFLLATLLVVLPWATLLGDSFVNFETGPVRPLAIAPERGLLVAANIPDNRV
jgi:hypothetical protein